MGGGFILDPFDIELFESPESYKGCSPRSAFVLKLKFQVLTSKATLHFPNSQQALLRIWRSASFAA